MNKPTSRREWFSAPVALLGAGALATGRARAQATPQTTNDIGIFKFALRLEYLQAAFYQQGLSMFKEADFQNSATVQKLGGSKIGARIYSYISAFALNELDHIAAIIKWIGLLDGQPQPPDCYNFGITTVDSFLQLAQTIENLTVMAYDGVVIPQFQTSNATVFNPFLQALVATIATVQARHAAYFNLLNMAIPFPTPFDTPLTMDQVVSAINPFLTTACNAPPVVLTLAFAGPTKQYVLTTNKSTVQLDGSLSTSATGTPLSCLWQQSLGSPPFTILNVTSQMATAILTGGAGEYTVSLKVTDGWGNSDQDTLKIRYTP